MILGKAAKLDQNSNVLCNVAEVFRVFSAPLGGVEKRSCFPRGSGELTLDELVEGARKERSFCWWCFGRKARCMDGWMDAWMDMF